MSIIKQISILYIRIIKKFRFFFLQGKIILRKLSKNNVFLVAFYPNSLYIKYYYVSNILGRKIQCPKTFMTLIY